jgi:hypothetical protein
MSISTHTICHTNIVLVLKYQLDKHKQYTSIEAHSIVSRKRLHSTDYHTFQVFTFTKLHAKWELYQVNMRFKACLKRYNAISRFPRSL